MPLEMTRIKDKTGKNVIVLEGRLFSGTELMFYVLSVTVGGGRPITCLSSSKLVDELLSTYKQSFDNKGSSARLTLKPQCDSYFFVEASDKNDMHSAFILQKHFPSGYLQVRLEQLEFSRALVEQALKGIVGN